MASFDWLTFFRRHRIEYVEHGPNVSAGNVNIACLLCGDDPSHHMGVSLRGQGWGCWRQRSHRGKSVARLIQVLLRCSWEEALRQAGTPDKGPAVSDGDFGSRLAALFGPSGEPPPTRSLVFTDDVVPLRDKGAGVFYFDYLEGRGFPRRQLPELVHDYGLRYARRGPFKHRVIIPIVMPQGLVNWTGRAIGEANVRYKTLTTNREKAEAQGLPVAAMAVDETLFNFAELSNTRARRLAVLEGPLDALKTDFYARDEDVRTTCTFGKNISEDQIGLLAHLRDNFDEMWLVQDPDAALDAIVSQRRLSFLDMQAVRAPNDVEDPGAMSERQVKRFFCQ